MTDLGFPKVGRQSEKGTQTYYLAKICQKMHENEENLTEGRGVRPKFYYVDQPLIDLNLGATRMLRVTIMNKNSHKTFRTSTRSLPVLYCQNLWPI